MKSITIPLPSIIFAKFAACNLDFSIPMLAIKHEFVVVKTKNFELSFVYWITYHKI